MMCIDSNTSRNVLITQNLDVTTSLEVESPRNQDINNHKE